MHNNRYYYIWCYFAIVEGFVDKARLEDMEVKVKELENLVITCICVVCQREPLHL